MLYFGQMVGKPDAMDEDLQPILSSSKLDLDELSVDELERRISALESDIEACRDAIDRKGSAKSAADAIFKFNKND